MKVIFKFRQQVLVFNNIKDNFNDVFSSLMFNQPIMSVEDVTSDVMARSVDKMKSMLVIFIPFVSNVVCEYTKGFVLCDEVAGAT